MADEQINPLVKLINERLPWLFSDYGFTIVRYSYDAKAFGNCLVLLESQDLRLRFIRDRGIGEVALAAKSDPEKWYELEFLLFALQGKRHDLRFEGSALLLKSNWTALAEALGPKLTETKREYERHEDEGRMAFERYRRRL